MFQKKMDFKANRLNKKLNFDEVYKLKGFSDAA